MEMNFGHEVVGEPSRRRGLNGKRGPLSDWNGGDPQSMNLQVDLGSSDMVRVHAFSCLFRSADGLG